MLFDLRSRGRRRTVQVVYIGLAVLIAAGLILFGVGTGSGGGGLFGAFTGNGSSSGQNSAVNAQTKAAIKETKKSPNSASAWSDLVTARYSAARSLDYDSTTSTYTKAGLTQLTLATDAYARYLKLTSKPSADTATLAATAYGQLGDYSQASATWQTVSQASPSDLKALVCITVYSYAAKQDRVAQLAEAKVLSKLPKKERKQEKTELELPKTKASYASQLC